jgi:hypothetical protein
MTQKERARAVACASSIEYSIALRPVAFRYNEEIDPTGTSQFRLVAEDVEKVNPDLVVRAREGRLYSVRYDQVNAMLLNEFLKEHRTVEQRGATIAELKNQIAALTAGLQKVSAQLELNKRAPETVSKNQ